MSDSVLQDAKEVGALATAGYVMKAVIGPTLGIIGDDIAKLYKTGRDKILNKAMAKGVRVDDGKASNPRVAMEVLRSGCFTEAEICAEYFGGILSASRNENGDDDSAMPFLEQIKSLSSRQLHLHYVIYSCLNKLMVSGKISPKNPVAQPGFDMHPIYFSFFELNELDLILDQDSTVLHREGLISAFEVRPKDEKTNLVVAKPYVIYRPTTYGAMLFAVASGNLSLFKRFNDAPFEDFKDVRLPSLFFPSLEEALESIPPKSQEFLDFINNRLTKRN